MNDSVPSYLVNKNMNGGDQDAGQGKMQDTQGDPT